MESLVRPIDLTRVSEDLRTGAIDPREYAAATCERIDHLDGVVQAFVPETGRAGRLHRAAEALIASGAEPDGGRPPLFGVPVGIKDIVHADGLDTRAGSALPPEVLRGEQAVVVDRLVAAGALVAGKTVTGEFAVTAPGPTRNPHRPGHTPGGTSSGSAAAVAAGMVPLAVGTQTIGSLIRPAAYCGVVGFKPSHGRIPTDGVLPVSPTFDTLGVVTAGVAGAALAAACLCDDWRPERAGSGAPVLGVPDGPYLGFAEPEALAAFEEHVALLRAAGHRVVRVPMFEHFEQEAFDLVIINLYEVARSHAGWFDRFGTSYDERTAEVVHQGRSIAESDHAAAMERRDAFRDRLAAETDRHGVDLWIAPSATGPAPAGLESAGDSVMSLPWSGAGLPCLTIPAPRPPGALPLGLQFVARDGDDERLLGWAPELERALSPQETVTVGNRKDNA
ncbi:amidase [Streptosporangium longisporum]|uniref:Amidase n=2 Tax=Streptosporangium longisporum TaxID=46187 RepID=A0ABN3XWK0_9ACTN